MQPSPYYPVIMVIINSFLVLNSIKCFFSDNIGIFHMDARIRAPEIPFERLENILAYESCQHVYALWKPAFINWELLLIFCF